MRSRWVLVTVLTACGGHGSVAPRPGGGDLGITTHAELAADEGFHPSYGAADLQRATSAERTAVQTAAHQLEDLERRGEDAAARTARADLAVRRRFLASLEACATSGNICPPRLDDPAWSYPIDPDGPPPDPVLDTPLRFDLEDWRKVAAELHGRACACRTLSCVDSVGVAIDQLEPRPMQDVQGDETASQSITWARECLFRLRGKR